MTTDREILDAFIDGQAVRPTRIEPGESALGRVVVAAASPVWLAVVAAIAASRLLRGRRPAIVMHERVGLSRSPLWVPKIATAEVPGNTRRVGGLVEFATGPPVELAVQDRVDRWLRSTGLDELPQLLLVARGDMRVVGPRPVTPAELAEMADGGREVGVDHLCPGLVGLWQVLDRHGYELDERRELDIAMIDNWSPRLRRRLLALSLRQAMRRVAQR